MLLNCLNRNVFKPFRPHTSLLGHILVACLRISTGFEGDSFNWRVPNPPGANPWWLKGPFGGLRSLVWQGVSSLLKIPTDSCHFVCTPGNPRATPIVTRGEGSFSYQGVSTKGVRHSPAQSDASMRARWPDRQNCSHGSHGVSQPFNVSGAYLIFRWSRALGNGQIIGQPNNIGIMTRCRITLSLLCLFFGTPCF